MRPVDRAGPVTGLNHAWFPRWEKVKDPGDKFWCQIRETKQTWRNTKILTFGHIIAWVTFKAVSLHLNGILMMRKIVQEMQDNAIQTARIHPAVHLGNRDEVFIWQNFQPAYRELWNRASPPLIWTHRKFYKEKNNVLTQHSVNAHTTPLRSKVCLSHAGGLIRRKLF